jgi:hypothetical protein
MERTRLQPGQIQLAQPFSDGPFGNLDGETAGDLRAQINAAPADHAVFLRIGPLQNQGFQFGQLRASQGGWLARAMARSQARNPCRIVAVHPVAQRLTIHPGSCRRFAPGATLQNERQGKQAANLRAITAFRCEHAKRVRRVLSAGKGERLAHAILPWPQRGLRGVNRRGGAIPSPSESQRVKVSDGWYKVVGFEVHETDSADHAAHLARRTALAEGVHAVPAKPVLHGDNGATLKATTVLAMLAWLGIAPSYSRPRVSDDNPFVEALFRTAKYRPAFPPKGFADLDAARQWAAAFVHWYNHEHHHSGIQYVTPAERHAGQDRALLARRHALYQQARERNPRRWSGQTRNWTPMAAVTLNPERDAVVQAALLQSQSYTRNRGAA